MALDPAERDAAKTSPMQIAHNPLFTARESAVYSASALRSLILQVLRLVKDKQLKHLPQPLLDVAASVAVTKPLPGDAWAWDRRKSPLDIAPLVAATGAVWLVSPRADEAKNPQVHTAPTEDEIAAWEKEELPL